MFKAPATKDPVVLSYLALRKAVGGVALALPFAMAIPWALLHQAIQTSISAYYYTGMRNLILLHKQSALTLQHLLPCCTDHATICSEAFKRSLCCSPCRLARRAIR